jgi:sigma-B regulation protein RsbU (phosphoserine phosphatase)
LRELARSRADLLRLLEEELGEVRLLDRDGRVVWPEGAPPPPGDAGQLLPVGPFGTLWIPTERGLGKRPWKTLAGLLQALLEAEQELNQLVDEHVTTTNQLIALYNITRATRETWDLSEKLKVIVEEAARQTESPLAILQIRGSEEQLPFVWSADGHADPVEIQRLLDRALQRADAHIGPREKGYVAAPIQADGQPQGCLLVAGRCRSKPYLARDLKILQALGDLASEFLATARLQARVIQNLRLEKELEIASQIQRMLVVQDLPRLPGLDLAAHCLPASQVGGDFYTVQPLSGDSAAFALGDVTGKGVPAALLMSMTRTVYRTLASLGSRPAEALRVLNEVLYGDLSRVEMFVTLVVGRVSSDGNVELANAGHAPVFLIGEGETSPRLLEPEAPPVGVLPSLEVPETRLRLQPGSLLTISSDGLHEARNREGELYGLERLGRSLAECASGSAASVVRHLLAAVEEYAGGQAQWDDQTLLVIKATRTP